MKSLDLKKNKKKGFTLIELIVVIAILAIIDALAIPSFNGVREDAAKNVASANARSAYTAGMAAEALATSDAEIDTKFAELTADLPGSSWAKDTNTATWSGTINGATWTATYSDGGAGTPTKG